MQHVLNIISAKIIIGAPCNVIPGLWELYANTLQPGERAPAAAPAAGGPAQAHSLPQVWLFGTQMELQPGP